METEESALDKIRTRPRFKLYTGSSPEEYEAAVKSYLQKHQKYFSGSVHREAAVISVKTEENFFWKPQLSLRCEKEDGKTVVRGVFAPNPSVWTLFAFLYFILGILEMVFLTLWFVGRQIKSTDFGWALPASIGVFAGICGLFISAKWGQKKSAKEMKLLRKFAVSCLKNFDDN